MPKATLQTRPLTKLLISLPLTLLLTTR